jgi:hypothetical protein
MANGYGGFSKGGLHQTKEALSGYDENVRNSIKTLP